jgi:hypothetical protein
VRKQEPPLGAPPGTRWFGGVVDKTTVTLGFYGDDLDPAEVTAMLGCKPTSSHRKGENMTKGGVRVWPRGAWLLSKTGMTDPEKLTKKVLDRLPRDERLWVRLAKKHDVQLRFGFFLERCNRGLDFTPQLVARMAKLHERIMFDIYCPEDALVDVVERRDCPAVPRSRSGTCSELAHSLSAASVTPASRQLTMCWWPQVGTAKHGGPAAHVGMPGSLKPTTAVSASVVPS